MKPLQSPLRLLAPIVLVAISCTAPIGRADTLEQQRKAFVAAEQALKEGQRAEFTRLSNSLADYPLYPYLVYQDIRGRLASASDNEIELFLSEHPDLPVTPFLRNAWLKRLAAGKRWAKFLTAYHATTGTTLRCLRLRALLETGEREAALSLVPELWLVGQSQPDECDIAFSAWQQAGRMTPEIVRQRIRLAMKAGHTGLARYLARSLDAKERRWVELWQKVHRDPALVLTPDLVAKTSPSGREILLHGMLRLAAREPDKAARSFDAIVRRYELGNSAAAQVRRRIGLAYAYDNEHAAIDWLGSVPDEQADQRVREWRILSAIRHRSWKLALTWLDRLSADEQALKRWRYWRARALEQSGKPQAAHDIYEQLAKDRHYYSFLAADRLELSYNVEATPLDVAPRELLSLETRPALRRAKELFALGRRLEARREWRDATRDMSPQELARAAKLAQRWGWHARAILTLGRTPWLDDLELRFPVAYREPVVAQANKHELEPAWLFAILRQESAFMPDAQSSAGALGLMQIMPRTGRQIAKSLKTRLRHRNDLLEAKTSIRFGSKYLRTLLDRLDDNPILATAAYNAGMRRVERWLPSYEKMPADVWIETVPFRETRNYLRRVFTYTAIYESRLGKPPRRLSERFAPIPVRIEQAAMPRERPAYERGGRFARNGG